MGVSVKVYSYLHHSAAVVIQSEDEEYSVPEGPSAPYITIPIVLIGMKEPGLECNVTVQTATISGDAIGKLRKHVLWSLCSSASASVSLDS